MTHRTSKTLGVGVCLLLLTLTSPSCLPHYRDRQFLLKIDQTNDFYYEPFPTTGDLNGDGLADIVIARLQFQTDATFGLDILLNDGNGGMTLATSDIFSGSVPLVQHPTEVIVADLNGDGRSDIFVANSGNDSGAFQMSYGANQAEHPERSGGVVSAT